MHLSIYLDDSDGASPKESTELHSSVGEESAVVTHEQSGEKGDGGPLLSLTSRDSLSHEVFSNLPEDLQEILRTSTFTGKLYVHMCLHAYMSTCMCVCVCVCVCVCFSTIYSPDCMFVTVVCGSLVRPWII